MAMTMDMHHHDQDMPDQAATPRTPAEAGIIDVIGILLGRLHYLVLFPLAFVLLAIAFVLVRGVRYDSESAFMPESSSYQTRLAGIAAQFGIGLPATNSGESVEFYARLVRSNGFLKDVVLSEFTPEEHGLAGRGPATLAELYGIEEEDTLETARRAVERLKEDIDVSIDPTAGLVTLRVTGATPELAVAINRRILDGVNAFNLASRRTRASAERSFLDARLQQASDELAAAEAALEEFYMSNRDWQRSPRLSFEASRLQRVVDLRQQVYVSLAQAHEQARLEEVRSTPVIVIVDPPEGFAEPSISLLFLVVVMATLGVITAVPVIFLAEFVARERSQRPADYERLRDRLLTLVPVRRGVGRVFR